MKTIKAEYGQDFFEKQSVATQLMEDKTPQEIWNFGPDRMEKIFHFACDLYDEKRYADASDLFLLLTTLNPREALFWKGFGFSSQQQSDFEAAALAYECALSLEPARADLFPCYLKSLCSLGRREQALFVLKELMDLDFAESPEELANIRAQGESIVRSSLNELKGE